MTRFRPIEIESTDLPHVRLDRAFNDPVIVHKYAKQWAPPQGNDIYDDVRAARLQQARDIPIDEHVFKATVPETVVYLATATMDSSYATPEIVDIYQHAYRDYLHTWTDTDPDGLGRPLNKDPRLTQHEKGIYQRIRTAIKTDRDRWFVEHRYDDLKLDVPKTYWQSPADAADGDLDSTVRDTIDDL